MPSAYTEIKCRLEGRLTTVLTKELDLLVREASISAKEKSLAIAATRNKEVFIATAREMEADMKKRLENKELPCKVRNLVTLGSRSDELGKASIPVVGKG